MMRFRSRAETGLPKRLEALGEAVGLAEGRLDDDTVDLARHVLDKADSRLRHGTTLTLVALLGATGCGKSSIANLLVGEDVATTGVRRPTTSSTLACIWGDDDGGELLDWLEVENRHRVTPDPKRPRRLERLILLDVPDHDSVAEAHRAEMERIAEHADVLAWVTEPQKYADKAMHDYLRGLQGHGSVMIVVLNKVDQLDVDEAEACRADLKRLLGEAGLTDVPVVGLSTVTGKGEVTLEALVADAVDGKGVAVERLSADVSRAAGDLLAAVGPASGADRMDPAVTDTLAGELVGASGIAAVTDAVAAGHRRDGAARVGWPFTRWLRRLRPHPLRRLHLGPGSGGRATLPEPTGIHEARIDGAIRNAVGSVTDGLPDPWPAHIRAAAEPDRAEVASRIDRAIGDSVRQAESRTPRWWSAANWLQRVAAFAVVGGALWLAGLALFGYLQLPTPDTPEISGRFPVPWPTAMVFGGVIFGMLLAFLAGRLVAIGANRRARAARRRTEKAVAAVVDELVASPVNIELDRRSELREHLETARGR